VIADQSVITLRQSDNEFVGLGEARGLLDLMACGVHLSETDVVADTAIEEQSVLGDDADLSAQTLQAYGGDIDTVDKDLSPIGLVQPEEEVNQCALAGAVLSCQRYCLARPDVQAHLPQGP